MEAETNLSSQNKLFLISTLSFVSPKKFGTSLKVFLTKVGARNYFLLAEKFAENKFQKFASEHFSICKSVGGYKII